MRRTRFCSPRAATRTTWSFCRRTTGISSPICRLAWAATARLSIRRRWKPFSSQGDGTLTVVKEDSPTSFRVEQTVATPARAKTLTLDPKTNQIFLITAEYGPVPAAPAQAAASAAGSAGLDAPPSAADDSALFSDSCRRQVIGAHLSVRARQNRRAIAMRSRCKLVSKT